MNQIIKLLPILFFLCCTCQTATTDNEQQYDVVVYGSTPAGIASAITAGRNGKTAVIIDPHQRIGGMPASGMSNTDFRTFEAFSGIWKEFTDSVA